MAAALASTAPFEEETTHKVDYQKWSAGRPFVHEPEAWVKPEGD